MDPALPRFEEKEPQDRLSQDDANRVEVIHTNVDHCGMREAIGHYDFYPNGGSVQPGCDRNPCSHSRAPEYFAESILAGENGFYGRKCSTDFDSINISTSTCNGDVAQMGGHSKSIETPEGIYYVKTRNSPPYALGKSF